LRYGIGAGAHEENGGLAMKSCPECVKEKALLTKAPTMNVSVQIVEALGLFQMMRVVMNKV
jgi:hypothetical protein